MYAAPAGLNIGPPVGIENAYGVADKRRGFRQEDAGKWPLRPSDILRDPYSNNSRPADDTAVHSFIPAHPNSPAAESLLFVQLEASGSFSHLFG